MSLGIYVSVPFCKTKCSYCNFASDVFSRGRMQGYVDRLTNDIASARRIVEAHGGYIAVGDRHPRGAEFILWLLRVTRGEEDLEESRES